MTITTNERHGDLQDAVARLLTATSDDPWEAADLETGYLPDPLKDAIATILNAVADGRLRIASQQPDAGEREALVEAIREGCAGYGWLPNELPSDIADALIAAGWTRERG